MVANWSTSEYLRLVRESVTKEDVMKTVTNAKSFCILWWHLKSLATFGETLMTLLSPLATYLATMS